MSVPQHSRNNSHGHTGTRGHPQPGSAPRVQTRRPTGDLAAISAQLTDRDRRLIEILATHRVLTGEQARRLLFGSGSAARHSLARLHHLAVVARFRREIFPGSQPWRYSLGAAGAALHAAATGKPLPRPAKTAEKLVRLAESPHTEHLLGVNEFFVRLVWHARTHPGCSLSQWRNESDTAQACGGILRPDGYGQWTQDGAAVAFFREHDTGTETITTITDKITKYSQLANAGLALPVLMWFTTPARAEHAWTAIATHHGPRPPAPVYTASAPAGTSPAGAVWLAPGTTTPRRLIDITQPSTEYLPGNAA